jgi:hypothetical protein
MFRGLDAIEWIMVGCVVVCLWLIAAWLIGL